jgi:mRNA-degrading endonuclease RelE of RelBE toxin-antitoxin system
MSYELQFKKKALKEWNKLNPTVQAEFLNILERRLENPRIPKTPAKGIFGLLQDQTQIARLSPGVSGRRWKSGCHSRNCRPPGHSL